MLATPSSPLSAKSITFKCKVCGAHHGGLHAQNICPDCWSKGHR